MRFITLTLLTVCAAAPVAAQFSVSLGYRADRYYGQAASTTAADGTLLRVLPLRPDLGELAVQQQIGALRVGLSFNRFKAGFGFEGTDGSVIQIGPVWRTIEFGAEAAATLRPGIRLGIGPVLSRWDYEGEPTTWVWGGQAALDFEAPVFRSLLLYGRLAGAAMQSPLAGSSVDSLVSGRLTRRSLVTGLRLKL